jgi:hypothetical protein
MCPDSGRCDPTTTISPKDCSRLTDWISGLGKEATAPLGEPTIAQGMDQG